MSSNSLNSKQIKSALIWVFFMLIPALFCIWNSFCDLYVYFNWTVFKNMSDFLNSTYRYVINYLLVNLDIFLFNLSIALSCVLRPIFRKHKKIHICLKTIITITTALCAIPELFSIAADFCTVLNSRFDPLYLHPAYANILSFTVGIILIVTLWLSDKLYTAKLVLAIIVSSAATSPIALSLWTFTQRPDISVLLSQLPALLFIGFSHFCVFFFTAMPIKPVAIESVDVEQPIPNLDDSAVC